MLCYAADSPALLLTVDITGIMDPKNTEIWQPWQQKGFSCFINTHPSHTVWCCHSFVFAFSLFLSHLGKANWHLPQIPLFYKTLKRKEVRSGAEQLCPWSWAENVWMLPVLNDQTCSWQGWDWGHPMFPSIQVVLGSSDPITYFSDSFTHSLSL